MYGYAKLYEEYKASHPSACSMSKCLLNLRWSSSSRPYAKCEFFERGTVFEKC